MGLLGVFLGFLKGFLLDTRTLCLIAAAIMMARAATAEHALSAWKDAEIQWKAAAGGWEAVYRQDKAIRGQETATARAAVQAAQSACLASLADQRRRGDAVSAILSKEPARDPQGCPLRELVPYGQLRDAVIARGP